MATLPSIKGSSEPIRMILLSFSLIGLQLTWGLEQTYCTPYLLSLGLTKSGTSAVWIAGPLSGLFMQPTIGALADSSTSRHGRRRPFMLGGSLAMTFSLLLLGWTRETTTLFIRSDSPRAQNVTIVLAVSSIYLLDFAINAVQACCRSIIVDVLPTEKQQIGNAWASRLSACGNVVGFLIGTINLVGILPTWLGGDTQFKKMCGVAITGLWVTVGVTCWAVREKPLLRKSQEKGLGGVKGTMRDLWKRTWNLPPRIQQICWCQFWAWIGWFPFLFYCSTWVGEVYYRYERPPAETREVGDGDALGDIGRLGSVALVMFSLVTFASSVLVPIWVRKPDEEATARTEASASSSGRFTPRPPRGLGSRVQRILILISDMPKPDLVTTWGLSQLMFAIVMFWAPFVQSFRFAIALVALCGVPNAVANWAPFAEMGAEINRMAHGANAEIYQAVDHDDGAENDLELQDPLTLADGSLLQSALTNSESEGEGELAGIYLGVLNVYTTLPQFVGNFISWVVFSLLEPGGKKAGGDGDGSEPEKGEHRYLDLKGVNAIAVCLFIGAICAVVGANSTRKLKKMA